MITRSFPNNGVKLYKVCHHHVLFWQATWSKHIRKKSEISFLLSYPFRWDLFCNDLHEIYPSYSWRLINSCSCMFTSFSSYWVFPVPAISFLRGIDGSCDEFYFSYQTRLTVPLVFFISIIILQNNILCKFLRTNLLQHFYSTNVAEQFIFNQITCFIIR